MSFEYAIFSQAGNMPEGITDVGERFAMATSQLLQPAVKGLETFQGGGWEIVSHDINVFGDRILGSFVIRRPK